MILDVGLAVRVITGIRTHTALSTGCPEWEAEGVRAALIATEGSPGAVLAAACLAAEDSSLRLPSANAFRRHWPANAATELPARRNTPECCEHREQFPCRQCEAENGPELTPAQIAANAKAIKETLTTHGHHRPDPKPTNLTSDVSAARARADMEATS